MKENQIRGSLSEFTTREDGEQPVIEGYFAVFNSNYDMGWDMTESIATGAFSKSLSNDVRALINHDTTLVLGRTAAHTLELREDSHGLWGKISINPKDSDAMNLYERVKRGDVSQCSFGFNIVSEETDFREDGSVHWTITEADLHEVSVCTFPAYEETAVSARKHDLDEIKKRSAEKWRSEMLSKLKGENSNA
jgi:HK97 family phage prohead protease